MEPTNDGDLEFAIGYGIMWLVLGGGALALFVWGVLALSAVLGLTSFSVMRLVRGKRPEPPADGGLDDLF